MDRCSSVEWAVLLLFAAVLLCYAMLLLCYALLMPHHHRVPSPPFIHPPPPSSTRILSSIVHLVRTRAALPSPQRHRRWNFQCSR